MTGIIRLSQISHEEKCVTSLDKVFLALRIHKMHLERMNGVTNQLVHVNVLRFMPSQANQRKHYASIQSKQKSYFLHYNNNNNVLLYNCHA